VNGGDGNDWLHAGWGADTVNGGTGDDHIWTAANDGMADAVDCGDGTDRAVIRPGDTAVNCEVVKTIS
jgi:Ca2+-binding RTX toxin-like protein